MLRGRIALAGALALATLLAPEGTLLATAAEPATLPVGDLAGRIWRESGRGGTPERDVNTPQFGSVTMAATSARQIQFGGRLLF